MSTTRDNLIERAAIQAHAAHYGLHNFTPEWLWVNLTSDKEREQFRAVAKAVIETYERQGGA